MLSNFTWIIPFFNEQDSLAAQYQQLSIVSNIIAIDAGSSDQSVEILRQHQHIRVFTRPNPSALPRTFQWYQDLYDLASTDYILFGNCNHFYPLEYLHELDSIASERKYVYCVSDHANFMYGRGTRVFSTINLHRYRLKKRSILRLSPSTVVSPHFFDKSYIQSEHFMIHNERPISASYPILGIKTSSIFLSFKTDLSEDIERKHSLYATEHGASIDSPPSFLLPLVCVLTYSKHFMHQYILRSSFRDGPPGFILSHYWALYHVSIIIRAWEYSNVDSKPNLDQIYIRIKQAVTEGGLSAINQRF